MSLRGYLWGWRSFGIRRSERVLEVGSGNRPSARADVLCDLGEFGDESRYGGNVLAETVTDRPFVFSDASRLPFRDASFDFLLSFHMLEHLPDPAAFLREAQRVSPRGCIVTPSESFELLIAERTHLWYVSQRDGRLHLRPKPVPEAGPFGDLFQRLWPESPELRKLLLGRPDVFEVRHAYEDGHIDFRIEGEAPAWRAAPGGGGEEIHAAWLRRLNSGLRSWLGRGVRALHSAGSPDLAQLLACPACGADAFPEANAARCSGCGRRYPRHPSGPLVMIAERARPAQGTAAAAAG